jgi:glycosyltransferase involved in cell wall biosynthesis
MRLLFVGTNRGPGGAESHFVALSGAMAAAGHEVAAVVAPDDFLWRTLAARGNVRLFAGEFRTKLDRSAMAAVRRAARAVRPQWIVGAFELDYWGTALVAAERRVPLALFRHHAALKRSTVRVLPRLVHRFVLPSEFLRRWAVARGIPHRRTAALPNPVDAAAFRPDVAVRAAQRAALGFGEEDVVVGFAGRFEHNKGVDVLAASLAAAMQQHAALRALWIGEGRLDGAVNASIAASGFATRHVRRSWADDPSAYYQAMDMLAFPSVGPEAFGRVSVEAQARACRCSRVPPAASPRRWTSARRATSSHPATPPPGATP